LKNLTKNAFWKNFIFTYEISDYGSKTSATDFDSECLWHSEQYWRSIRRPCAYRLALL